MGKPAENHNNITGKSQEKHRNIIGKSFETHRKPYENKINKKTTKDSHRLLILMANKHPMLDSLTPVLFTIEGNITA